jgi:hypothetical protein
MVAQVERPSAETSAKQPLRGRMVIDAIHPKEITAWSEQGYALLGSNPDVTSTMW